MIAEIQHKTGKYKIDFSKPLDISIPVDLAKQNINAWYLEDPEISPVQSGDWVGSVEQGADVNFNTIVFNPHAHITHTECVGHITKEVHSVNKNLKQFFYLAEVVTLQPALQANEDLLITKEQLQEVLGNKEREAIVIRTTPNSLDKKSKRYSNTNPPYLAEEAGEYLREKGIEHLLIDLPSVDKEKDEGKLLAHNAFWNTKGELRMEATITEFIFVANEIKDGVYFLNLMIAPFENDASPSKPILYKIEK
ncbi:cyclase family protein [uncultured Tenacibaculum sp.]|uniref:cyclase family protein n=1 Tax=uncultured Tenacibaculum sp. TaxID=174713 RepID=UPI0026138918|nr:cyclase family protein [uncultured Tenacibaculum sp.]